MSKHDDYKESQKKAFGTTYDDAFKTLLVDCPKLLIPVVNEAFGKSYTGHEKIIFRSNEHLSSEKNSKNKKRITDSTFTIMGEKPENYIFECQSSPDNSMIVRMFEYAAREAFDTRELSGNTLYVTIPNAAVLFLRSTKNTPDIMKVDLTTPGGHNSFDFHVMKMKDYSLQNLFEKGLYFLLPFYIFVHEESFAVYNTDDRKRKLLTDDYISFMEQLKQAEENGLISTYECGAILDMSRKVLEHIAANYDAVKKGVQEIMGGRVLDYETKRIYNAGKADGVTEGKIEGETESMKRTARKLYEMGMNLSFISEAVGVEEITVREWLE